MVRVDKWPTAYNPPCVAFRSNGLENGGGHITQVFSFPQIFRCAQKHLRNYEAKKTAWIITVIEFLENKLSICNQYSLR